MSFISVRNVDKTYKVGETKVHALRNVSLDVEQGEFVAIVGPSGSGKSTLLHMLGGMDTLTSGEIDIDGIKISGLKDEGLSRYRRDNVGFIFQYYNLISVLNVVENIVMPVKLGKNHVDKEYIETIIHALQLDERKNHFPCQLSGGQQQRVAIARALANKPSVILADEPTGNLDSKTSQSVIKLLKEIHSKLGQTILMITHDENVANQADRILEISDGHLEERK